MNDIISYYTNYAEEDRLFSSRCQYSEFLVTMHLLRKYIPLENSNILDCCAGTGAYAFSLAKEGASVTAGDLVPVNTEKMKQHPNASLLKEIYTGSALDLSRFADDSFDVVLCMGALYHLLDAKDRDICIRECLRVLRPGGILVCAWESHLSLALGRHLIAIRQTDSALRRKVLQDLDDCCKTQIRDIFYGMTPEEVESIAEHYPVERVTNASTYAALYLVSTFVDDYTDDEYDEYIRCLIETCEDDLAVKYAMHGLYICRKTV